MRLIITLFVVTMFFSCKDGKKKPDVSNIKIEISTRRFDKELFTLDTNNFGTGFDQLMAKYPSFKGKFIDTILNLDQRWPIDSIYSNVAGFITYYKPIYDTTQKVFKNFAPYENEIKNSLQYLQYYFPKYKAPHTIITFVGPLDGLSDAISDDAFIIGLHAHLGKTYSLYKETWLQETYPEYVTNRFEPSYIVINCMKNIINDIYPQKEEDKTLLVQMVDKGKQLYMLSLLLPGKEEYKLIGYTEKQMEDCYKHESQIWDLFLQNNFLQTIDNNVIKNYVEEGPKTQELGEGAPGNIGSFTGWQIVKKYMEKNSHVDLKQLMETDAEIIFEKTKYKP